MWNLKYDTKEPVYETDSDTDVKRGLVLAKGPAEGEVGGWG